MEQRPTNARLASGTSPAAPIPSRSTSPATAIVVLSLLAASVAGYLAYSSATQAGLPVGCGDQGGCAEVLRSRWSSLMGISVTYLALPIYLGLAAAGWAADRRWAKQTLLFGGTLVLLAAFWFVALQAVVLRAWCPWCLTEHALGLALFIAIAWRLRGSAPAVRPLAPVMAGAALFSLMAAVQIYSPAGTTTVRGDDVGSQAGNEVTLLDGHLVLNSSNPSTGLATAEHSLYIMFDYCCPHCRRTHGYLMEAVSQHPNRLRLICLPVPRDAQCNPEITETESRFEHACELATIALKVWQLQPDQFPEFDRWLFESKRPRTPTEAREKAVELLRAAANSDPATALDDPQLEGIVAEQLQRNIKAFNDSQVQYLPVLMAPGIQSMIGRPESQEAVIKLIEDELFTAQTNAG